MKLVPGKRSGFRIACSLAAAVAVLTGVFSAPALQNTAVVHAQAKRKASAPLCNATTQPNIGNIANAISNSGKGPFMTDLNQLSQAAWCTFIRLNWPQESNPKIGDCLN